ncbi:MAG: GtrA family protein [Alphaproteobacteria bacterium]|nr:GtrA family protein [Alphaproteobacteria bacterium]
MREEAGRVLRFVLNGLFATVVHYGVLAGLIEGAGIGSAAIANALAAVCGIAVSYAGNRNFVLRSRAPHRRAGTRFLACYAAIVALHGGAMALWADIGGLDYRIGFLVFTGLAAILTYLLNRFFVFREAGAELSSR